MKTNKLCLGLCSLMLFSAAAKAQNPTEYIKWQGENDKFYQAYNAWKPGQPLYPNAAEDENFFISRIKPRERFRHSATQIDKTLSEETDKNVLNWVPIGQAEGGNPNALPSGIYDSDVFSMWSYITHYGNWTAPMIRMPGAFADVAHKNGVVTSTLASIPWAVSINATDGGHGSNLAAMYNGGADKFVKFLKQYGIDGWGMNSEFSTNSTFAHSLQDFMAEVYQKAITDGEWKNYAAAWYTLVGNDGSMYTTNGLGTDNMNYFYKNGKPVSNYAFGNYNWGEGQLSTNKTLAEGVGRSSLDVYAGMNLQAGQYVNWLALQKYPTSIGLWGAHNMNIFFESRNELGSAPEVKQTTYLGRTERFFSNGAQNPAKKFTIQPGNISTSFDGLSKFHGISAMATAKSVLSWNLDDAAFFSFFNLGNGQFFNIKGKKAYTGEWYNIAMQDYLPTWRYWFAQDFLGTEVVDNGLKATFTWDDAWFGGSCMKIYGTSATEYLHLFKTKFALKKGDKIRLRFKVISGSSDINLAASAEGSETDKQDVSILKASDVELGEWVEKVIEVKDSGRKALKLAGKTMAVVGLEFANAQDLELRLGEFSILRGDAVKPAKPVIDKNYTKILKYNYKGLDAKVIFNMEKPANMEEGEHIYNSDVKTAFFKVYIEQAGKQSFVTATTSWAALLFAAPFNDKLEKKVKIGVSAVGLDGVTESDIAWSDELTVEDDKLSISDKVVVDKATVKPGQEFTVKFEDTNHQPVTWKLFDLDGNVVKEAEGNSFSHSFDQLGVYTVQVFEGNELKQTIPGLVQVSSTDVGSVPEIKTFTFNSKEATANEKTDKEQVNEMAYTSNNSNGTVSQGLNLKEAPITIAPKEVFGNSLTGRENFSFSFWVRFAELKDGQGYQLFNIRNPMGKWPNNNWGTVWSDYTPGKNLYHIVHRCSDNKDHPQNYYDLDLKVGVWTHFCFTFEKKGATTLMKLYINGQYLPSTEYGRERQPQIKGDNTEGWTGTTPVLAEDFIMFGGSTRDLAGIDGAVDDVKVYNTVLTPAQVKEQMLSSTPMEDSGKDNLVGFWDFEVDANANGVFVSPTSNKAELAMRKLEAANNTVEGATKFVDFPPSYTAGCPFVAGSKFKVETSTKWIFDGGQLSDKTSTETEGSAKVTYKKDGLYTGKLILLNSWGKAERTIKVINVGNVNTAVEELTDEVSLQAFPNPFVEQVNLHFAENGQYIVGIYDLSGKLVSRKTLNAYAGSVVAINVDAPKGIYLLRVQTAEGKLLRTIKLQKK